MSRLTDRYDQYVVRNETGCWGWAGHLRNGYAVLSDGHSGKVYAHRLALEIALGEPLAEGVWALHTCDNRVCTNPDHLYAGDQDDNGRDVRERRTARKPSCRRGHTFTDENTYWHRRISPKNGREYDARICRECQRQRGKKAA